MTKNLKKTACFICAFTVLTVSLLWLAWGIKENTKYHRITAQITDISEFSTENSNFYKSNGKEKYTAFFDFSGHVRTFSIRIYSGKWSQGKDPLFNLSLQNKDGQQWRNWDNAHAMSGDSILSFLTTLL